MPDTYVHFEIPADDPDRLMGFYGDVFGWRFQRLGNPSIPGGEYIAISTRDEGEPGLDGGMYKKTYEGDGPRSYISVASVDATVGKVEAGGGRVMMPRMAVAGIGWIAVIADPEGNVQGVIEADANAR